MAKVEVGDTKIGRCPNCGEVVILVCKAVDEYIPGVPIEWFDCPNCGSTSIDDIDACMRAIGEE